MASKLQIANRSYDRGQKPFRFVLSWPSGGLIETLYHAPKGWNDFQITYMRHEVYNSVLRNAAEVDLTFVKEGRDLLQTAYETEGVDADVSLTVTRLNRSLHP